MVQASFDSLNLNTGNRQLLNNPFGNLGASLVRIIIFVVVRWKAIKIINYIRLLSDIDLNIAWAVLPVGRKDDYCFGFDFCRDLSPDCSQFGTGRVFGVFHEVRPANAEEVDRYP